MVFDHLEAAGEEWRAFADEELKITNEKNAKTLGGNSAMKDECELLDDSSSEEENDPDSHIEQLMRKFSNQIQFETPNKEDDDPEKEEEDQEPFLQWAHLKGQDDVVNSQPEAINTSSDLDTDQVTPVKLAEHSILEQEFLDYSYWKVSTPTAQEIDYDTLFTELEY